MVRNYSRNKTIVCNKLKQNCFAQRLIKIQMHSADSFENFQVGKTFSSTSGKNCQKVHWRNSAATKQNWICFWRRVEYSQESATKHTIFYCTCKMKVAERYPFEAAAEFSFRLRLFASYLFVTMCGRLKVINLQNYDYLLYFL